MQPSSEQKLTIELQIEELEDRIAPDGGETVLPLSFWQNQGGNSQGQNQGGNGHGRYYKEGSRMDPMTKKEGFELEINIEELEAKIAPDGGETVLPLPIPCGKKH